VTDSIAAAVATTTPDKLQPSIGYLVAGFALLAVGLAVVVAGRRKHPEPGSRPSPARAALLVLVYAISSAAFMHVLGPAVLGRDTSAWLFALGDVIFVALGLLIVVMLLAEGRPASAFGVRGGSAGRLPLALIMGIGAVAVVAFDSYAALFSGRVVANADSLVFATLFALLGSAVPEELLFRGYLMSSLDGRMRRWSRVIVSAAAFTAVRCTRFWPGEGLGMGDWMVYISGAVLPLGLWWGLMRELSGGSIWPGLASHFLLEFGTTLARTSHAPS
jgi:membrane protease YdiL (CAAX protease family)